MARVYVYERPVDSVQTDVSFYEKLHPITGVLVKEEPRDADDNSQGISLPLANTNVNTTTPAETTVEGTQLVHDVNNKENKLVSSANRANEDKSSANVVSKKKRKRLIFENLKKSETEPEPVSKLHKRACRRSLERKSLVSASKEVEIEEVECGVCYLKFRTGKAYKIHRDYYHEITDRICDKCQMSFRSIAALDAHKFLDKCKTKPHGKSKNEARYSCCFCNRKFSKKPYLQSHMFHIHIDLLPNVSEPAEANETGKNNEINKNNETDKHTEVDKIKETGKVNDTVKISEPPLKESIDGLVRPSSEQQKETIPAESLSKRMRQTTMTEFLSGFTKRESVSPKKVDLITETPRKGRATKNGRTTEKFNVPGETPKRGTPKQNGSIIEKVDVQAETPKRVRQNGAVAKFISTPRNEKTPTTGKSSGLSTKTGKEKTPFVEINMDSDEMVALLDKPIKVEVEDEYSDSTPQTGPYNLRRASRNSIDVTSNKVKARPVFKANRRRNTKGQFLPIYEDKSDAWSMEERLRAKFKCKDCKVNLVRCDMVVKTEIVDYVPPTTVDIQEDIEEVWRKKINLKRIHVPLIRLNDPIKVEVNDTFHNPEKPRTSKANIKTNLRKIFRCKICRKYFSTKKNLYNHLEVTHVFYISSVCSAWYKSRARLLRHYLHQHGVLKRMECCVCFEKFSSPVLLKRHMGLHCIRALQSKRDKLFYKEAASCNVQSRTNSCEACGKHFWLGACLSEHQQVCQKMKAQLKKSQNAQHSVITSPTKETPQPPLAFESVTVKEQHPKELSSVKDHPRRTVSSPVTQPKRLLKGVAFAKGYNIDSTVSDKEKFSCTTCGAQFQNFQNLCLHGRTYSQAATHVCESCNTAFTTQKLLQNHVTATHMLDSLKMYKYFCTFCTQGFRKKVNLQIHTGHFHGGQTPIIPKPWLDTTSNWEVNTVCNVCNLIFESSERFIEHNMYYYKGQMFTCTFCNQTFQGMYMLNHHNKFVHYTEDMTKQYAYTCNICNEGFTQESQHHAHKLHVHSKVPEINTRSLQDHTYAIKVGTGGSRSGPTTRYNCEVCYMNFMVEEDLRQHELEYSNNGDYLCSYCARRCPTDSILSKHESLSHTCRNFTDCYKCRYCEEVLSTCTALKCHEVHFHQKISNTPINSDNQAIVDQSIIPLGNVETPFACSICGMKFLTLEKLNHHNLEYSNVGLYNCHICSRRFPELYRLEVHKLKHSNLNYILSKHHCPICREGFANPVNVRTHVLHFHQNELSEPWTMKDTQTSQAVNHKIAIPKLASNSLSTMKSTKCRECLVSYDSESALKRHQARFANKGQHVCEHCGRRFPLLKLLKEHLKRHVTGVQHMKYACPECDDRLGTPVARYQHIVHLHGKSKWIGDLPLSIKIRYNAEILNNGDSDLLFLRSDTPPDQLIYAGEPIGGASLMNTLSDGQEKSTSTVDQQVDTTVAVAEQETPLQNLQGETRYYTCPLCNVKIQMMETFVSHLKLEHGMMVQGTISNMSQSLTGRVISCLTCGITFTTEDDLKRHLMDAHLRICPADTEDAPGSVENDEDVVETVWEEKPDASQQLGDQGDSEDHAMCWRYRAPIMNCDKTVPKPAPASADGTTLRIKDFAKLV